MRKTLRGTYLVSSSGIYLAVWVYLFLAVSLEQYVTVCVCVCVWQLYRERAGRVDSAAGLHPSAAGE